MVDMVIDKNLHHDRETRHARIFNAWIKYWESDTLITRDQDNEQRLHKKYNNLMFLDDEYNHTYTIAPENLEFKGPTRSNRQFCVVIKSPDWKNGYTVDLLISIYINDDFIVLIKEAEQDPVLEVIFFIHQWIMIGRL